jgi:hypothetical protein
MLKKNPKKIFLRKFEKNNIIQFKKKNQKKFF